MIVACDIGGVVRDMATGEAVMGALDGLAHLSQSCQVLFISKCGQSFKESSQAWLSEQGLAAIPTYFCESNEDKVKIAAERGVMVMIDDRIQVLRTFPEAVVKIWFCEEEKKISGTRKHQPELFQALHLARSWEDVVAVVKEAGTAQ